MPASGRQDHTTSPSAATSFVSSPLDRSRVFRQPALPSRCAPNAAASTASHPAFVTTRDRPSCRNGTAEDKPLIWGVREAEDCPSCQSAAIRRAITNFGDSGHRNSRDWRATRRNPNLKPISRLVSLLLIWTLGKPKRLRLTGDIVTPVSDGNRVAKAPRTRHR
jgi:hypothetical protein